MLPTVHHDYGTVIFDSCHVLFRRWVVLKLSDHLNNTAKDCHNDFQTNQSLVDDPSPTRYPLLLLIADALPAAASRRPHTNRNCIPPPARYPLLQPVARRQVPTRPPVDFATAVKGVAGVARAVGVVGVVGEAAATPLHRPDRPRPAPRIPPVARTPPAPHPPPVRHPHPTPRPLPIRHPHHARCPCHYTSTSLSPSMLMWGERFKRLLLVLLVLLVLPRGPVLPRVARVPRVCPVPMPVLSIRVPRACPVPMPVLSARVARACPVPMPVLSAHVPRACPVPMPMLSARVLRARARAIRARLCPTSLTRAVRTRLCPTRFTRASQASCAAPVLPVLPPVFPCCPRAPVLPRSPRAAPFCPCCPVQPVSCPVLPVLPRSVKTRASARQTLPTLQWTGKVGDALVFWVWGALSLVRDAKASKLSSRTLRCIFLGFPTNAPLWQFYHPCSRRVFSSQVITFDESVRFYRLHPHASHPVPLAPLFLVPSPAPVDPLPHRVLLPQQPAAVDYGAATGGDIEGEGSGGAETEGEGSGGAATGGADSGGAASPSGGGAVGDLAGGPGARQPQQPSLLVLELLVLEVVMEVVEVVIVMEILIVEVVVV
ncbi:unnamed protein product [Closterium sp. NIES-53]